MCLGANGISMFHKVRSNVTTLTRTKQPSYFILVQCMAHRINLVMQSLSSMPMVYKLEDFLQLFYGYFFAPPNVILNFKSLLKL
jgi:hypothetical protein